MKEPSWYRALDLVRSSTERHATPAFTTELSRRSASALAPLPSGRNLLRRCAVAIAYSQGARSQAVGLLVRQPAFRQAFLGFAPGALSVASPAAIRRAHWHELRCIRFRTKVDAAVKCAQVLTGLEFECGSFPRYLARFSIPRRLPHPTDVDSFWVGFDRLQADLRARRMPFFSSTTSLLQLLLDLDHDSAKPDLIVMRLARRLGVVPKETGDPSLRLAVRSLQAYAVARGLRTSAVDWHLLAYGGQSEASRHLTQTYCVPPGPCGNASCAVGRRALCCDYSTRP